MTTNRGSEDVVPYNVRQIIACFRYIKRGTKDVAPL